MSDILICTIDTGDWNCRVNYAKPSPLLAKEISSQSCLCQNVSPGEKIRQSGFCY